VSAQQGMLPVADGQEVFASIGADDSLHFNLPFSFSNGVYTDIPVYFHSDDSVFAIDFAIRFNMQLMEFDSIIDLTGSLLYLYYFNWTDSVLRFTSNSLVPIDPVQPLLSVRMRNYLQPICFSDISIVNTWLNGDVCTGLISGCIPGYSGGSEIQTENFEMKMSYASGMLSVISEHGGELLLSDLAGKLLFSGYVEPGEVSVDAGMASDGCHIIVGQFVKKVMICN
jgi:hypothetical protein